MNRIRSRKNLLNYSYADGSSAINPVITNEVLNGFWNCACDRRLKYELLR